MRYLTTLFVGKIIQRRQQRTSVEGRWVDLDSGQMGDPAPLSTSHIPYGRVWDRTGFYAE